jgi:hypothetical protein
VRLLNSVSRPAQVGGLGLNLVCATRVFLMDPWYCLATSRFGLNSSIRWNPAVEEQAIARVHRVGQTKQVQVVRYIVSNSIEERLLEVQSKSHACFFVCPSLLSFAHRL